LSPTGTVLYIANKETRSLGAQLVYENECIVLTTDARRTFFEDRDLRPNDQIALRVTFKTLGEVRTGISDGEYVEVIDGLSEGQTVVVSEG